MRCGGLQRFATCECGGERAAETVACTRGIDDIDCGCGVMRDCLVVDDECAARAQSDDDGPRVERASAVDVPLERQIVGFFGAHTCVLCEFGFIEHNDIGEREQRAGAIDRRRGVENGACAVQTGRCEKRGYGRGRRFELCECDF